MFLLSFVLTGRYRRYEEPEPLRQRPAVPRTAGPQLVRHVEPLENRVLLSVALHPDPTFGGDGVASADTQGNAFGQAVLALPDGKVLAAARAAPEGGLLLARFNADGSADASFAAGGLLHSDLLTDPRALTLQADGKVLVAGLSYAVTGRSDQDLASRFGVIRITAGGAVDESFGDDGLATVDFEGTYDVPSDLAISPDGRVVVVGSTNLPLPPRRPATRSRSGAALRRRRW